MPYQKEPVEVYMMFDIDTVSDLRLTPARRAYW